MESIKTTNTGFNESMLQQLMLKVDELLASRSYDKEFLTLQEAGSYLGVQDYTVSKWIQLGMLPASKPFKVKNDIKEKRGRSRTYVKKSDLLDLLESSRRKESRIALEIEAENRFIDELFSK